MTTTAFPRIPGTEPSPQPAQHSPRRRRGGFRLGALLGVDVHVDVSLVVIFALIVTNLGGGLFPRWHPDWPRAMCWLVAMVAAALFFVSVLAHELSHAVVARRNGIRVSHITLFLFGGVAHLESAPPTPKSELLMAIVGPVTSAVIGAAAIALGTFLAGPLWTDAAAGEEAAAMALSRLGPLTTLLLWLGPVNVSLAVFNMVPGFPLDGGRVFRSIVWAITGDLTKATRWAAGAGQLFGWMLIALGAARFFQGAMANGLWLVLIGWFLTTAARSSMSDQLTRDALADVPVRLVMRTQLESVSPESTVAAFVREHSTRSDQTAFPVEHGGKIMGLVTVDDVRRIDRAAWSHTPIVDVMTPLERLVTLPPDAGAARALEALAESDVEQIPIVEDAHFMGMVRRSDLVRWLSLQGATLRT